MSSFVRDPKRLLATLISGVLGLVVLIDFSGDIPLISLLATLIIDWAATLTALALVVGVVSVAGSHVQRVRQRNTDWLYSLVLLLAMVAVIIVGVFFPLRTADGGIALPTSLAEAPIRFFFRLVYEPLANSLLALLAFYSVRAALRAFRRGTLEAIVIIVVALLVLVAQLPIVTALPYVGLTLNWINDSLVLAGARGLLIGTAIGTLVAAVRVLLGFDQPYLDR